MKATRFLAILFLFITPVASAQVTLKFNPEEGANYIYQLESKQNINTQMPNNNSMSVTMDINFIWDMVILKKTQTESEIQIIYSDILFLIDSPLMKVEYSSAIDLENLNEHEKMLKDAFEPMIGKPITITITADGKVTSVKGTEGMFNQAGNVNIGVGFDENSIKDIFEQSFNLYPEKSVNIDDSWDIPLNINMSGMSMAVNSTYTLKSVEDGVADIYVTSDIDSTIETNGDNAMTITFSGTQKGSIEMDVKTGIPTSSNITQSIRGTLPNDIIMNITSDVKTLIKKK